MTSPFFGKENESKALAVDKPLRRYWVTYKEGQGTQEMIFAHYLQFTASHINFWQSRADNEQDTLVLSKSADSIFDVVEALK